MANTPEESMVICSKGYVRLRGPAHCPSQVVVARAQNRGNFTEELFEFELPKCPEGYQVNFPNSEGMLYQVQAVEECLKNGQLECPEYSLEESLAVVQIMDAYRKQVGVKYPRDA